MIQFNQSAWLAEYIIMNTNMRRAALNDFEREFFKLMVNSIFGAFFTIINLSLFFIILIIFRKDNGVDAEETAYGVSLVSTAVSKTSE